MALVDHMLYVALACIEHVRKVLGGSVPEEELRGRRGEAAGTLQ